MIIVYPQTMDFISGILTGRGEEAPLGQHMIDHHQVVLPVPPIHLVGLYPNHVIEAQPRMRRFHVGEEHPPHPRVGLSADLVCTLL